MTMILSSDVTQNMTQCLSNLTSDAHSISSHPEVVIFFTAMASLTCAFTISANVIVVLSMSRSHYVTSGRRNRGHDDTRISNVLMTSMAGTDVIIGTFVMPLSISEMAGNGEWQLGPVTCSLRVVMDIVCCTLSIYHVVAMAVDRYLAVCRPWVYRSLTPRTAYVIILVCWMIPLLLVSVPMLAGVHHVASDHVMRCALKKGVCVHSFSSPFLLLSFSVSFYIPITATLALYLMIARKIFRRGSAVVRSCSNRIQPGTPSEATSCATPVLSIDTVTWDRVQEQSAALTCASVRYLSSNCHGEAPGAAVNKSKTVGFCEADKGLLDERETHKRLFGESEADKRLFGESEADKRLFGESKGVRDPTSGIPDEVDGKAERPVLSVWNTHRDALRMSLRSFPSRRCQALPSRNQSSMALKKLKSARTIGLVVICFVVSWLPFSVVTPLVYFRSASVSSWTMKLVSWMGYMNSAWNPLLFCCNRRVRQAISSFRRKKVVSVFPQQK